MSGCFGVRRDILGLLGFRSYRKPSTWNDSKKCIVNEFYLFLGQQFHDHSVLSMSGS